MTNSTTENNQDATINENADNSNTKQTSTEQTSTEQKTGSINSFNQLALAEPILKAIAEQGYDKPTPIQAQSIPAVLAGRDVMAAAQTGTGKTAGFTLPLLQKLITSDKAQSNNQHTNSNQNQKTDNANKPRYSQARALIITPTRELAAQIADNVTAYSKYLPIKSAVVFGGVKINPQMQRLRGGVDILIATPGRLLDLYQQNAIRFDELEVLILDEADRMLDMGFIHDIKKIIRLVPAKRQNLLFSATFADEIRDLAKELINDPVEISVTPKNSTAEKVSQLIHPVDKSRKPSLLIKLIQDNQWYQVLVFARTKHGANRLCKQIEKAGITAAAIHGNKSQGARTRALAGFKAGDVQVLVATDIAARGIDIDLLPFVVNFDLPNVAEDYVHRIGRTGRAGSSGQAISLVSADELKFLKAIERLTQQVIPRETIAEFEPQQKLAVTTLDTRPIRVRPKKNKSKSTDGSRGSRSGDNRGNGKEGRNSSASSADKPRRSSNGKGKFTSKSQTKSRSQPKAQSSTRSNTRSKNNSGQSKSAANNSTNKSTNNSTKKPANRKPSKNNANGNSRPQCRSRDDDNRGNR